ncbi:hypothetical protein F53441_13853 [Fusarium austroafricanum]|uniref:Uncharacterized protein n=1 Tax=Fusarium austroafricanum TaxID=2364996 RepID=A0A8H4JNH7_9HYPO|nr:hypothetical protein F53441_13853 [Fusarium austroafricanum]
MGLNLEGVDTYNASDPGMPDCLLSGQHNNKLGIVSDYRYTDFRNMISAIWPSASGQLKKVKSKWQKYRQRVPPKRPPLLLTTRGMAFQLLCQIAIIVTIFSLWHYSNVNNGIATVGDSPDASFDSKGFHAPPILGSSIVWATVPAWIMSAYSSLWSAMLDSLKKVQPLLELEKAKQKPLPGAEACRAIAKWLSQRLSLSSTPSTKPPSGPSTKYSTIKNTLLLDYGEWPIINGFRAMRVGHVLVGICLLLRAALWTAGGLTAAIFASVLVPSEVPATLYSTQYFDEYLGWRTGKGTTTNASITPALDIVSATVLRDGENYPWTTDKQSFLPFFPALIKGPGNYTFDTEAYSASTHCNVATEEDLVRIDGLRLTMQADDEKNSAHLQFGFRHENCSVDKWFLITNTTSQYARTWSTDCNLDNGRIRFGMFSGTYNASEKFHISNLTVITCKPLIYRSNVTLSISVTNNTATPKVLKYSERTKEEFWPFFASAWFRNIPLYSVFDPTVLNDMDTFSRLVIGHASGEPTLDVLPERQKISQSFGTVFRALFANFVALQAYSSAPKQEVTGTLSRLRLRLFVVKSASIAIITIVGTALVTTVILALQLHRNRHILRQYLDLMLGTAILLRSGTSSSLDSYVDTLIGRGRATPQGLSGVDLVKFSKQQPGLNSHLVWAEGEPGRLEVKRAY